MIETHVLIDESGAPLLRGTYAQMLEQSLHLFMMGRPGIKVEPIKLWDWTIINWGD